MKYNPNSVSLLEKKLDIYIRSTNRPNNEVSKNHKKAEVFLRLKEFQKSLENRIKEIEKELTDNNTEEYFPELGLKVNVVNYIEKVDKESEENIIKKLIIEKIKNSIDWKKSNRQEIERKKYEEANR